MYCNDMRKTSQNQFDLLFYNKQGKIDIVMAATVMITMKKG